MTIPDYALTMLTIVTIGGKIVRIWGDYAKNRQNPLQMA